MVAYRIGIDVGGTFTDFVAVPDDGSPILRHKVSSTPDEPARAVGLGGMADLLEQLGEAPPILTVTHGTTIGLNAIIQRRGGKVVLAVTEGFADLLEIGRSRMPDSFNLHAVGQQPLVHRDNVLQLRARLDPEGGIVRDSDDAELAATARRICELAPETVVVNLVNGYANPDFEQELAGRLARAITKHGGSYRGHFGGGSVAGDPGVRAMLGRGDGCSHPRHRQALPGGPPAPVDRSRRDRAAVHLRLQRRQPLGGGSDRPADRHDPVRPGLRRDGGPDALPRTESDHLRHGWHLQRHLDHCRRPQSAVDHHRSRGGLALMLPVIDVSAIGGAGGVAR